MAKLSYNSGFSTEKSVGFKIQRFYSHMLNSYSVEMSMQFFWPELLQQCNIYNKIQKYKIKSSAKSLYTFNIIEYDIYKNRIWN